MDKISVESQGFDDRRIVDVKIKFYVIQFYIQYSFEHFKLGGGEKESSHRAASYECHIIRAAVIFFLISGLLGAHFWTDLLLR